MNIQQVLLQAISQRPEYIEAVGYLPDGDGSCDQKTDCLSELYAYATGTPFDIQNQSLMDLIPGFRIIHLKELSEELEKFKNLYPELSEYVPFLADYGSSYIAVNTKNSSIYMVSPEYTESKLSESFTKYWETIEKCYEKGIYFLDSDGYLDCDFDGYYEVGAEINSTCEHWSE